MYNNDKDQGSMYEPKKDYLKPADCAEISDIVLPHLPTGLTGLASFVESAPAAFHNTYCTNCLKTRRFFEKSTYVVCETCSKRMDKVTSKSRKY